MAVKLLTDTGKKYKRRHTDKQIIRQKTKERVGNITQPPFVSIRRRLLR